jgi:hypothetical protein
MLDKDCAKCPSYSPNYPTSKCDYTTKKCVKTYECGVSNCSKDSECCGKAGEVMPHYECDTSTGYPRKCILKNTCGKNQCDPKDDKVNSVTGNIYNPKCTMYACNQTT